MVRFIEKEKGHSPIHGKYAKEEEEKKHRSYPPNPPPPNKKRAHSIKVIPKIKYLQFTQ